MNPRKLKMTSMTLLMLPCVLALAGMTSTPAAASNDRCWMTGGGSVFTDSTPPVRVTHGFVLNCDVTRGPNNLEINWGGNRFHLITLTDASCSLVGNPKPPTAGFDTYRGSGLGYYSGEVGANGFGAAATWTFTDAGEPGKGDFAEINISDPEGNIVLTVSGYLTKGNQQAHGVECSSSGGGEG
ncbi:MAG: hypothetical protein P9F19_15485 [Candidatus Contendobacter sp.]|nr:hypothetical protein [Candidatus Contendobacter sp.]MDG4558773.1 hypothetical protein [Candidatus Contendobacter sp.]